LAAFLFVQAVRGAKAAFTAVLARKAPRTSTEAIVAKAASGDVVGDAGQAEDRMCTVSPASRMASRSRRL